MHHTPFPFHRSLPEEQATVATSFTSSRIEETHSSGHIFHSLSIEHFPDMVITLSKEGIVQKANAACETILGYPPQEMQGRSYTEFVMPDDIQHLHTFIEQLYSEGAAINFVHPFLRKDGMVCHISWSSFWLEREALIYSIGRDVTELKKAQDKQVATEQLLQAVIENSFDLLALIDENGQYLYVSESVHETKSIKTDSLLGYKAKDIIGTNCFIYMHPDDLPRMLEQFQTLFKGEKKIHVPPYRFKGASGNWHWMESIVTNQLAHPDIKAIVVSAREISHQIESELKLKEMQLLEALVEGEEKERSRIASDLHDGVSGMIAAAKMQFAALSEKLDAASELKEFVQGMDLLEKAVVQVRTTSHNLMPEILLENGLSEALCRYCSNISHDGFDIAYLYVGDIGRFSPKFELSLYRIAQELIGNAVKHSGAKEAFVQLSKQQEILSLAIEDNGKGFILHDSIKGTGLKSVKKRVETMNGQMEIHSEPGKGTSIYLEFEK